MRLMLINSISVGYRNRSVGRPSTNSRGIVSPSGVVMDGGVPNLLGIDLQQSCHEPDAGKCADRYARHDPALKSE